jgi:hypothetical protein
MPVDMDVGKPPELKLKALAVIGKRFKRVNDR